ncbi:porin family protein [bacterium]|nr:porin family protein [bacterium]MBU1072127.1 porin family protein [bacterium]MBU1676322.1 porin family protein [bacterium]
MRRRPLPLTILSLLALLVAGAAAAQDGRWLLGLDGLSSHVQDNNEEDLVSVDEQSGGAALQVGYRFSPAFMLRVYGGGADHATNISGIDIRFVSSLLEGVYLFGEGRAFRPYLFGGVGGYKLESQQDALLFAAEGAGISFGGGAHYLVGGSVSLHGSVRLEAVNWNKVTVTYSGSGGDVALETPVEESGFASKVTFGVAFWL